MFKNGRSDRIRTCGLLVPNQAHYQTVPHPGVVSLDFLLTCAIGEGTEPPNVTRYLQITLTLYHIITPLSTFFSKILLYIIKYNMPK